MTPHDEGLASLTEEERVALYETWVRHQALADDYLDWPSDVVSYPEEAKSLVEKGVLVRLGDALFCLTPYGKELMGPLSELVEAQQTMSREKAPRKVKVRPPWG